MTKIVDIVNIAIDNIAISVNLTLRYAMLKAMLNCQ